MSESFQKGIPGEVALTTPGIALAIVVWQAEWEKARKSPLTRDPIRYHEAEANLFRMLEHTVCVPLPEAMNWDDQ